MGWQDWFTPPGLDINPDPDRLFGIPENSAAYNVLAPDEDRMFGIPEDAPIRENFLDPLANFGKGIIDVITPDTSKMPGHAIGSWFQSPDPEEIAVPTGPISGPFPEGGAPWDNTIPEGTNELYNQLANPPTFEQDPYMPTGVGAATDEAYNSYMGMLENTVTGPSTDRIGNIYDLAMGEAARQNEAADRYEAGALANIETDSAALMENLGMLTDEFDTELDIIRERQSERIAGSKETRNDRIDQAIEEYDLGEAAATFLVTSTKTSDILDAQGSREQVYSGRMDRLYAGWALDREMDALGLTQQAKRNVANQVLAMKENVAQFQYNAQIQNQEMLMNAEAASANRANELAGTLAELGLNRDLAAIQNAEMELQREQAYDADWDRSAAFLEGPFGAAIPGMTPDMISALDDSTLLAMAQAMTNNDPVPIYDDPMGIGINFQVGETVDGVDVYDPRAMQTIPEDVLGNLNPEEYAQAVAAARLAPDDAR